MLEGVDYSRARPGGARLKAAGKRFAVRYLYPGGMKGLTVPEVNDLHRNSIQVVCVYEGAAGDMRRGRSRGVDDARLAQAQLDTLPLDRRLPIYFAKDYDGPLGAVEQAYLAGAASVVGKDRVGLYGGWQAIDDAMTGKHAAWFWQTYAWSAGRVHPGIHLFQYANGQWGGQVDYVRALRAEYGQNPPAAPTPVKPAPTPPTDIEEDPMPVYFKGKDRPEIFILNRTTGRKRHILPPEWKVAGQGQKVILIDQASCDAIPAG